ncbi:26S proteasome non-ATPase regulatory subunit 5 [Entophlyctis luteolus]|nr:26S proteasome non-ATPase regulatory subunit 5 [Entophlyctis luteolus]
MTREHNPAEVEQALLALDFALAHVAPSADVVSLVQKSGFSLDDLLSLAVSENSVETADLSCKIIKRVCAHAGLKAVDERGLLIDGLQHPSQRIRSLVAQILCDPSTDGSVRLEALPALLKAFSSNNPAPNSSVASALLVAFAASPEIPEAASTVFSSMLRSDSASQVRVCEFLVDLAEQNCDSFTQSEFRSNDKTVDPAVALAVLLNGGVEATRRRPDVMVQLNAIELAARLALVHAVDANGNNLREAGFDMLARSGVLTRISTLIDNSNNGIEETLLCVAAVSFFVKIAKTTPFIVPRLEKMDKYLTRVGSILTSDSLLSDELCHACFSAICYVGAAGAAGVELLSFSTHKNAFEVLLEAARPTAAVARRVSALDCLSRLFENNEWTDERVGWFCQHAFESIGGCEGAIFSSVKSHDEGLRISGYECLIAVVKFSWALESLRKCGQLIGYLLDRSSEKSVQLVELRYKAIKATVESDNAKNILQEVLFSRFVQYAKEGAFHREYVPTVTTAPL